MKQGGRDAPNDLLDKLLTGTLVAFELCLPSTSSQTNLHSESEFSTSAPTQASSMSSTKEGKDREEMRCVAFRSLCNLSDCDSADALGNPFDPFDPFVITYPNIIQSLFGQSAFSLLSPSKPNAILSYIKPNQALCEPYSVYTISQISSYPKPILLLLHPNLPTTLSQLTHNATPITNLPGILDLWTNVLALATCACEANIPSEQYADYVGDFETRTETALIFTTLLGDGEQGLPSAGMLERGL